MIQQNEYQHQHIRKDAPHAIPRHIGILMDGNGRWAQQRSLPRTVGHRAATENVLPLLDYCDQLGVEVVTLYVFSTENWQRPPEEVKGFLALIGEMLDRFPVKLDARGYRFWFSGSFEGVSESLRTKIERAVKLTKHNSGLVVNVAFNYGGRNEIVRATRRIVQAGLAANELNADVFESFLDTAGLPEIDLVIRTSGEQRLSNFCLWQSAHAVFYVTPVLWPEFTMVDLKDALATYANEVDMP